MIANTFLLSALWWLAYISVASGNDIVSSSSNESWYLGSGFHLTGSSEGLQIKDSQQLIWSTTIPFISASAGNDSVVGESGAFNITKVDEDVCKSQTIDAIQKVSWDGTSTGSAIQVSGLLAECGESTAPYTLTFWVPNDLQDRVAFYLYIAASSDSANPLKKLYFRYASNANEDFYGLGAQASFASLKNQSIPIFSREQGVGRGDEPVTSYGNQNGTFSGGNQFTTYTAIPSYVSTDGNAVYLSEKSTALAFFDFTDADKVEIRYGSLSVDGVFMRASDMFDAVEMLTAYTGRMPALPQWVDEGAILGIQGGQEKVQNIVEMGLEVGCPISAVWLQDWCGTHSQEGPYINISRLWWNWENDEKLYPTWPSFVQNLRDDYNVRTLSYINTFLTNVSSKEDCFRRNLYEEASALQYFVQNTTTESTAIISSGPGLEAGIVDLTNEDLQSWFKDVLTSNVWSANISGFMTDFGEYTPVTADTSLANIVSDAFFFHSQYPFLWAQYHRNVVEELGMQDEALLFHRSASMGSNRYMNLFWAGDQNIDWKENDGIKSAVTIMAHMGLSGYAHSHSDVGGYTNTLTYEGFNITRSPELLGRWGEMAAVSSSVFRSHEGNIPSVNAQFYSNSTTYEYYAYNTRMFVSLAPYRRKILETECATKGWPLLRPPVMYHTDDPRARQISYESFYLGPSLYVAPVMDPETFELDVYLPGGKTYRHVWSGQQYEGGQDVRVATPYGKPAVFLVEGASMPELKSFLDFVKKENGTKILVE